MFHRKSIIKDETIVIAMGEDTDANVHLVMNPDEPVLDVIVTYPAFRHDETVHWHFYMDGYSVYFEIKHLITDLIDECNDIDEFINVMDDALLDCFGENLIESSFNSYEDLHGYECEECEKKDSCEEYLKHKN